MDWFERLGLRPVILDSDRHRRVVRACSKQVAQKFRELFGTHAEKKRIPHSFMMLPERKLIPLIRGMWLGDGDFNPKYRTARYSTTSPVLAKQLFALLVKLGFMPSINKSERTGKREAGEAGAVIDYA